MSLIIFGILAAYAQGPEPEICQAPLDPETAMEEMDLTQLGGLYLTAEGQIRILVIYVRFRDDNDPHNYWPAGSPPSQMNEIIDPDMATGSTNFDNLTHYFNVMSLGIYQVVGEAVYVETPHDMAYYGNPPINSSTVEDVLVNAVDPIVDFSQYDNWTRISNYNHENSPDGVVDMIVMVWRGKINPWSAAGWASLGGGSAITLDGVTITRGYPTGSGVTVQWPWDRSEDYNFKLIIHELGHWLISGTHPYGSGNPGHSIWGMLTHPFDGVCANPFERERLGWIDLVEITGEVTANLADYVTTGEAYKYHPPNGATNEFYYFANHQKLHTTSDGKSYDDATVNSADKGIFVMHQQNIYSGQNNILCKVAPGHWDWENPFFTTQCFSQSLPAYRTVSVNLSGTNHRATQPNTQGGWEWIYALADEDNNVSCGNFRRGDQFNDSFNPNNSTVISPWSNPNTHTWSGDSTDFAMEVLNQSGNIINVHFYVGNAIDAPPARILDLSVTESAAYHPYLSWTGNSEPDLLEYRIYKKRGNQGWAFLASTTNTFYEDLQESTSGQTSLTVQYRVTAVDTDQKESAYSNVVSIEVRGILWKGGSDDDKGDAIPTTFSLLQNYPNPFNPTTTIEFGLPKESNVRITVYNVNGKLVKTLISRNLPTGYHRVLFDGSDLASGIYLYRIKAGEFSQVRKMMLIK